MIDTMIALAAVDKPQRVIVAGSDAFELYRDLTRRGFFRVTTTTCRIPCGWHEVAFVAGQHTLKALDQLLTDLVPFLNMRATITVSIDTQEPRPGRKIQSLLERLGFRVEAGAKCRSGFVLSARRREADALAKAA